MTTMPEDFLAYPEPVREAARNLLIRVRTGFASDVLTELAGLIDRAGTPVTVDVLAEHAPYVNPGTGYISACSNRGCDGLRFGRDEEGNRLKDEEPARRWAAHVMEVLRG